MKELLAQWVREKIGEHPKRYASDGGKHRLAVRYLQEVHGLDVDPATTAALETLFRAHRRTLEDHPELDHRVNDIKARREHPNQLRIDFDRVDKPLRAGARYLTNHPEMLTALPSRIAKSVRGLKPCEAQVLAKILKGAGQKKKTPKPQNHGAGKVSWESKRC